LVAPALCALSVAVAPRGPECMKARKPPSIKGERSAPPAHHKASAPCLARRWQRAYLPAGLGQIPPEQSGEGPKQGINRMRFVKGETQGLVAPALCALSVAVAPRGPECTRTRKPLSIKGERSAPPAHHKASAPCLARRWQRAYLPAGLGQIPPEQSGEGPKQGINRMRFVKGETQGLVAPALCALLVAVAPQGPECMKARKPPSIKEQWI
ncbi:hypothetical protein DFQ00_12431, partial [Paenibacillus barcinonensis]